MTPAPDCPSSAPTGADQKRARILESALAEFSTRGYSQTSMADIARAAGMSRPALYLHFRNKEEIFRAALESLLRRTFESALGALDPARLLELGRSPDRAGGTDIEDRIADQLDGFLQGYHGDLKEALAAAPHGDEMLVAQFSRAGDLIDAAARRTRRELTRYFKALAAGGVFAPDRAGQPIHRWVELIQLSPFGLKQDHPSVAVYRRRLETLARSVAAGIVGRS